ncbi:MAG: phosphate acyltransferase PlsX [Cellvibrionales bacterium]|nr:phosphate acyltransferase PlsX [Cellvibrionales bacterium]
MSKITIAIDAMGGDFGPEVIVPSVIDYLKANADTRIILVGDSFTIKPLIPNPQIHLVDVVHCDLSISMDAKPSQALRQKSPSSLHLIIDLLSKKEADAALSAGNTGALMAVSKQKLGMIEGITRPLICGVVPSVDGHSYLLDMGANVDCDAKQLLEFALIGTLVANALDGKVSPSVALLNNGEEEIKGNSQVKQAAELLTAHRHINYIGFIEGHNLYQAVADIIVCDGFVGNVALKASEGVANFILDIFNREFKNKPYLFPLFWILSKTMHSIGKQIDPRYLNGASFLGVNGVVVKSHGHADSLAFTQSIIYTKRMIESGIVEKLQHLSQYDE